MHTRALIRRRPQPESGELVAWLNTAIVQTTGVAVLALASAAFLVIGASGC